MVESELFTLVMIGEDVDTMEVIRLIIKHAADAVYRDRYLGPNSHDVSRSRLGDFTCSLLNGFDAVFESDRFLERMGRERAGLVLKLK